MVLSYHLTDELLFGEKRKTSEVNERCSSSKGFNNTALCSEEPAFTLKNEYHSAFTWTRYMDQSERSTAAWEREGKKWGSDGETMLLIT
ncbi:uncharacterized [Tachysurus ichikawai]